VRRLDLPHGDRWQKQLRLLTGELGDVLDRLLVAERTPSDTDIGAIEPTYVSANSKFGVTRLVRVKVIYANLHRR
jgi:hypothetical protein